MQVNAICFLKKKKKKNITALLQLWVLHSNIAEVHKLHICMRIPHLCIKTVALAKPLSYEEIIPL